MRLPVLLSVLLSTLGSLAGQGPALALLGAPAPGATPALDAFVRPVDRVWPSTLCRSGTFLRTVCARLTGHTVPDVVVLDGLQPVLLAAPGIHRHVGRLLEEQNIDEVYDVAVLRGRGLDDGSHPALDALALVTDEGLKVWRRDPVTGTVSIGDVPGTGWTAVRRLATHPADPLVIFGIDDDGVVLVAEHTGSSYATMGVTFPALQNPLAIACIDWDGDQSTDLAVLTRTGLSIVDRLGNTIAEEEPHLGTAGTLTLVRGGELLSSECLVWLTPATAGTELRLRSASSQVDQPLYRTFVDAAAADWSGDGNEDLVLSTAANEEVTVLVNLSTTSPTFLYHPGTAFQVAVAASGNRPANGCSVATADFDGDGDADLVATIEPVSGGSTELRLVQSRLYDSDPLVTPVFVRFDDIGHGEARVTFSYTAAPGGSHTRMTVWKQHGDEIDPRHTFTQLRAKTETSRFEVPVDLDHFEQGSYVLMVQPVLVVNGHVVEAGEAALAIMSVATNGGSPGVLVNGSTPLPSLPPPPPDEPPPTPGG